MTSAPPGITGRSRVTVETIVEPDGFASLQKPWGELLEASAADCVFLSWEWLSTWWKHLSRGRRLCLITVQSDGELIAVAPFMIAPPRVTRLVPFRSLEFMGTGSVGSDYLDIIVRRGREEEGADALASYLADEGFVVELAQLHRESCLARGVVDRLTRRGWRCVERLTDACPFISLGALSWSDYLAGLDGHHRANFRRRLSRLSNTFEMRFERAESERDRQHALRALVELHHRRWRARGGSTALYTPELLAFHDEWSRLALERGWLRLYVMSLGGRPVAALYGIRYRDTFCFYQTGFDPSFARHGVGQVTVGLSIKSALGEGAQTYDLLHGDESYKFDWARQVRQLGRIELYPPGMRGRLSQNMTQVGRRARKMARRLLPASVADRLAGARGLGL